MLKVIIADDERIQREGIAKHGKWSDYDMQVAGLADDGLTALELMRTTGADVLITDIKMPNMNGLELARQARNMNPGIKIIVVSGYDDFEYARAAIDLKAHSFLLKPVAINRLNELLEQIVGQCRAERQSQAELLALKRQYEESKPLLIERFLENVLYGFLTDEETILGRADMLPVPDAHHGYRLLLLQLEDNADSGSADMARQLTYLGVHHQLADLFGNNPRVYVVRSKENEFALIVYAHEPSTETMTDILTLLRASLKLPPDSCFSTGISAPKMDLTQLNEAYKESETACRQKFYLGKGNDIYYQDIVPLNPTAAHYDLPFEQMIQAVEIGNAAMTDRLCTELLQILTDSCGGSNPDRLIQAFCYRTVGEIYRIIHERHESIENVLHIEAPLWDRIHRLTTLPEVREWLTEVVVATAAHIHQKRSRKNAKVVESIIRILEQHYDGAITIEELARQVYLTPNYISNIFKESVGESIIDYLTKVRMKHAARMLQDETTKIYEIAEKTGYNSTSYFSVVFKGMYGMSPKDYRDSCFAKDR